ncbi:hypothetical protein [Pseudobacillus badius]|nr:hypothetical protein [Bacillus badius]TDW04711.1 hypothetical protein B0G66_102139 [Bacillus badius]GLY09688.1 hypothetical protein Bbad01_09040 [Bacillus badius]
MRKHELTLSSFIHKDQFDLNAYVVYLFHKFSNEAPKHSGAK